MFKILKSSKHIIQVIQKRTFLSEAYYCNEVWKHRLQDPIIQKVNLDELYNEIDQKYQKTKTVSAVDVDIFVNTVDDETYTDEVLDLCHKLRMSADSSNTLNSTSHATIRNLASFGKYENMLSTLDDRLNYGLFLDNYLSNLLLDIFWKNKDYTSGARVASQLMLQEDFEHPLCASFSLLHCYNYLLNPGDWPHPPVVEEPEEEVKIRVNYLRNPYDDNHFDLRHPQKIVGKSLIMINQNLSNTLEKSFHLVGLALFEQHEAARSLIQTLSSNQENIYEDIVKLIPENNPLLSDLSNLKIEKENIQQLLQDHVKSVVNSTSEKDIAEQCENYYKWDIERQNALNKQQERLLTAKRLANIEIQQKELKEKEMLLWYFENEEKIELLIDDKKENREEIVIKQKITKTDETYIPPEVQKRIQ